VRRSPDRPTAPAEGLTDFAGPVKPSVAWVGGSGAVVVPQKLLLELLD